MSLPWVKVHVSLLDNEDYKRFTPQAQHLYVTLLMLAGKQDNGDYSGRIATATGPLKIGEVRAHARYDAGELKRSLNQLLNAKFVEREADGTLVVARFKEKAAPLSALSTERSRQSRARSRNGSATLQQRRSDRPEAEVDNYASLRSAALSYPEWPRDPEGLSLLAGHFLARFANCVDPDKQRRQAGPYAAMLASMRQRGVTIEQAWDACEQAWRGEGEAPLFGGKVRRALDYLPARSSAKGRQRPTARRTDDAAADLDRTLREIQGQA